MTMITQDARIEPYGGIVNVMYSDAVIASTENAIVLHEAGHEPVVYIPFADIYFEFLQPSDATTVCPRKGVASYWNASAVGRGTPNVMWSYMDPSPGYEGLRDHGAFFPHKVTIEKSKPIAGFAPPPEAGQNNCGGTKRRMVRILPELPLAHQWMKP